MMVYLQLALVLIVLRFPIWIVVQYYIDNEDPTDTDDKDNHLERLRPKGFWLAVKQLYSNAKVLNRWSTGPIEVCIFSFMEGADAFSLTEDIIENGQYFAPNKNLVRALLLFINFVLLLTSVTNCVPFYYGLGGTVALFFKLGVVTVTNVPLFVIRMYMFSLVDDGLDTGSNTIFLLFSIKELVTLLLTVAEVGIEVHNERKSGSNKNASYCTAGEEPHVVNGDFDTHFSGQIRQNDPGIVNGGNSNSLSGNDTGGKNSISTSSISIKSGKSDNEVKTVTDDREPSIDYDDSERSDVSNTEGYDNRGYDP